MYIKSMKKCVLLMSVVFLHIEVLAFGEALPSDVEKTQAPKTFIPPAEMRPAILAYDSIVSTYNIPVCYEDRIPLTEDINDAAYMIEFEFPILRGTPLAVTLDLFAKNSGDKFRWKKIHSIPVIFPVDNGEEPKNLFETKVSFELKDVSTSEAFKTLVRAINTNSGIQHEVVLSVAGPDVWKRPAKEIIETKGISLSIQSKPAREAACAIVEASPIPVLFRYSHSPISSTTRRDVLTIGVIKDGIYVFEEGRLNAEEDEFWIREALESLEHLDK